MVWFVRLIAIAAGYLAVGLGLPSARAAPLRWSVVPRPTSPGQLTPRVTQPSEPIPPLTISQVPWPSPSLNPGVPSAFTAQWGDVFVVASAGTASQVRDAVDGSWLAGFGLGDAGKAVALEVSGGCGSVKNFCSNGGFGVRLSRLLVDQPTARVALAGGWQNGIQWGNEGRQDNIYSATLSYALPLRPGSTFAQTLLFNAGVGNSTFAPYSETASESRVGAFGSVGVELSPALGLSAGWSGRGMNAQLSYAPLRDTPLTINLLGADLLNQTPDGTVGVLTVGWGANFATPDFNR
jgi:hypothetical protein